MTPWDDDDDSLDWDNESFDCDHCGEHLDEIEFGTICNHCFQPFCHQCSFTEGWVDVVDFKDGGSGLVCVECRPKVRLA